MLATSNPCFEVWLVLHHQEHDAWLETKAAERLRHQLDGSTDKEVDPAKYMQNIGKAASLAVKLEERHKRDGTSFPNDNPSSGMHRLIASVQAPAE